MILCMLDIDWCIYSNDQWSFLLQNLPHSFWWITPDSKMIKKIEKVSRIHKWFLHNIQLTSIGFINVPAYEIKSPEQAICDSQKKTCPYDVPTYFIVFQFYRIQECAWV